MQLGEQIGTSVGVILLLAAVLWGLRRKGWARFSSGYRRPSAFRRLELVERLALAPQHCLHLVRVDDRLLLVGQSASGLSMLEIRTAAIGPAVDREARG